MKPLGATQLVIAFFSTAALTAYLAAQAPQTTWSGVYSDAQAKRGETVFTAQCASCHGPDLAGVDPAPALTGAAFNTDFNDTSLNDLVERVLATMPADKPGTLTRQDAADVIAFILSKDSFPAGQADLPTTADALKPIKFVAVKPQER